MMRIKSGIICALSMSLAFAFACADSGSTGDDDDTGGSGSQQQAVCGDATCDAQEVNSCPSDCGSGGGSNNNNAVCGNGMCETTKGETASSCFSDCGGSSAVCGNGMCETGETTATCAQDCASQGTLDCADPNTLLACFPCLIDATACVPPYDATSCAVCLGP